MNRFTVIERDNCVLIEGSLSSSWFCTIAEHMPKGAVMSSDLARMLGANFAFGLAKDVDALIASIKPGLEAAARQQPASGGLSVEALLWLATGERGNSSETMFTHLTGVDANSGSRNAHPYDPDDLRRCMLLLDQCPELKPDLHRMSEVSPAWAGLVRNWNEITVVMLQEIGDIRAPKRGASAPRTYNLIKNAIGEN